MTSNNDPGASISDMEIDSSLRGPDQANKEDGQSTGSDLWPQLPWQQDSALLIFSKFDMSFGTYYYKLSIFICKYFNFYLT